MNPHQKKEVLMMRNWIKVYPELRQLSMNMLGVTLGITLLHSLSIKKNTTDTTLKNTEKTYLDG